MVMQRTHNDDDKPALIHVLDDSPVKPSSAISSQLVSSDGDDLTIADIERWPTTTVTSSSLNESELRASHTDKYKELEDEHDRLSESVVTLSTQFAHIQFRLQQIAVAPEDGRNEMLKDLLAFASEGCIDISAIREAARETTSLDHDAAAFNGNSGGSSGGNGGGVTAEGLQAKRSRVLDLIAKMRAQTEDLERFAYEHGHGGLPMSELKERQRIVFDKLAEKVQLNIQLEQLSGVELTSSLDRHLDDFLTPIKEKEQLVDQLQTQITDLERFVAFLQAESSNDDKDASTSETTTAQRSIESAYRRPASSSGGGGLLATSTSMFGLLGIGGRRRFERNELKKTPACNHYGDQRAQLELAMDEVLQVLAQRQLLSIESPERDEMSAEQLNEHVFALRDEAIVTVVRKRLAPALRALFEHGIRGHVDTTGVAGSSTLAATLGLGCFSARGAQLKRHNSIIESRPLPHVWCVLTLYADVKRAEERRDAAIGSLTQSYALDSVAGRQASSQQVLIATIENIRSSHDRLQRSLDAKWKAWLSAALNQKRLPDWLRLVFRADFILTRCYHSWSYLRRTGGEDIRELLERLHVYSLSLPVDLAIRFFDHTRHAF